MNLAEKLRQLVSEAKDGTINVKKLLVYVRERAEEAARKGFDKTEIYLDSYYRGAMTADYSEFCNVDIAKRAMEILKSEDGFSCSIVEKNMNSFYYRPVNVLVVSW